MKKCLSLLSFCLVFSTAVFANNQPPLNTISFRLQAESWATTNTAKVIVSVDAAANAMGLSEIQARILSKLRQLSKDGDWHITHYRRSQDSSGLEHINALAEARLPRSALAHLRLLAKKISKPGESYKLQGMQFNPSQEEIQSVKLGLHQEIYEIANEELAQLQKLYPKQHYVIHKVTFETIPMPLPSRVMMNYAATGAKSAEKSSASGAAVSRKVVVSANIEFASIMK